MEAPVGRERLAAAQQRAAVPRGHAPARRRHHAGRGGDVPRLHVALDRGVDHPARDQQVHPEVAEPAGARDAVDQVAEQRPVPRAAAEPREPAVGQVGLPQRRDRADLHRLAVAPRSQPGRPVPPLAHRRRADHADHGLAVDDQGEQCGPHRHAAHEVLGPVDGVDQPGRHPGLQPAPLLLPRHGVGGEGGGQPVARERLDLEVGLGDRAAVGLRARVHPAREPAQRERVGLRRDLQGDRAAGREVDRGGHWSSTRPSKRSTRSLGCTVRLTWSRGAHSGMHWPCPACPQRQTTRSPDGVMPMSWRA